MTILNIIFTIVAIVANAAMTFFASYAFVTMRKLQKDVGGMKCATAMTLTLTMGSHVKQNFDDLNSMKETFNHLVETEQYEEAQKMHDVIEKAERAAMVALEKFRETCGSNLAEIIVTKVKNGHIEDDDDD